MDNALEVGAWLVVVVVIVGAAVVLATKVHRDATGADLQEAADAVRRLGGRA